MRAVEIYASLIASAGPVHTISNLTNCLKVANEEKGRSMIRAVRFGWRNFAESHFPTDLKCICWVHYIGRKHVGIR